MVTLIIGLPGCGKSVLAKRLIEDGGICYDLDAIASAFRLKQPHEERCEYARRMANDLLIGWRIKAYDYHDNIVIIRTAPTTQEAQERTGRWKTKQRRLKELKNYSSGLLQITLKQSGDSPPRRRNLFIFLETGEREVFPTLTRF